jgi:hemolysin III
VGAIARVVTPALAPVGALIVTKRKQTVAEEIANASLHGVGALFAVAGLVVLVLRAAVPTDASAWQTAKPVFACAVYAATLVVLFLSSTLYHALTHGKAKRVFQVLDHSAIYLLIAGTDTPVCALVLPPVFGLWLAVAEWLCALTGIVLYAANVKALKKIETAIYLLMGWAIVAGIPVMLHGMSKSALVLLCTGGLLYTVGVYFYKKHERKFFHVIWHVFVLAAAALQWTAVFLFTTCR